MPIIAGRPRLMHQVEDGVIEGYVAHTRLPCNVCGHVTMCVVVNRAQTPANIDPDRTILKTVLLSPNPNNGIGIGCGCYAKLHRQIAHIMDRIEERKNVKS